MMPFHGSINSRLLFLKPHPDIPHECETRIYTEGDRITGVGAFDELFYKGKNLFGMTLVRLRSHLGPPTEIGEAIGERIPVEYEQLGIQVWLGTDGLVDSVMCHEYIEPD